MKALCVSSHRASLTAVRPEAELFIGLQERGVAMTVMTQRDSVYAERMAGAGIEIIDFEPRRKVSMGAIRSIRRQLRTGGHQILHLFNNRAVGNGILAALGLPVRVVTYRGQTGNVSRYDPVARMIGHLSPRVDRVCCVAEAVRRDLIASGLPPDQGVTIYKGHDLRWYDAPPADRSALEIAEDAFVIGLVANARPRKGVPVLLEALRRLPADAGCEVLLVGEGMQGFASERSSLPGHIRLHALGYREDADRLIAACDLAVLPALRREGLPKSVIEAMARGIAPVVTDTGGNAELVRHGESGLVVPPGDPEALAGALLAMYRDPLRRRTLGLQARQRIHEHFSVEATVERTLALYRELAGIKD